MITRKQLEGIFETFCKVYNLRAAKNSLDHGAFQLEKTYTSRWIVYQIDSETTGHSHPFGHTYRTTREMYECLSFAIAVKQFDEQR